MVYGLTPWTDANFGFCYMMFLHRLNRLLFFVELQQTLLLDPF